MAGLAGLLLALFGPGALAVDLIAINPQSPYPEGPLVVGDLLYYAEMGSDRVMRWDGTTNAVVWRRPGCGPTSVARGPDGTLLVLCHREPGVAWITTEGATLDVTDRDRSGRRFTNPNASVNDGKGGVYFSSSGVFSPSAPSTGAVLHRDRSGAIRRVAEGIHYANGVALAPGGRLLYVSEHLARRVLAFDVAEDGSLSGRRVFVALDDLEGADPGRIWEAGPDGLAVDGAGNLVIAEYAAGHVLAVDAEANLIATIAVPERFVTAPAFSADEKQLYITAPVSFFDPTQPGKVYSLAWPP